MRILRRHVICLPGSWKDVSCVESPVQSFGEGFKFDSKYSRLISDQRMSEAFSQLTDQSRALCGRC